MFSRAGGNQANHPVFVLGVLSRVTSGNFIMGTNSTSKSSLDFGMERRGTVANPVYEEGS